MGVFFPLKNTIHVISVLLVGASLAIRMIAATSATSGRRSVAGVGLPIQRSCLCNMRRKRRGKRSLRLLFFPASPHLCRCLWAAVVCYARGSIDLLLIDCCLCNDIHGGWSGCHRCSCYVSSCSSCRRKSPEEETCHRSEGAGADVGELRGLVGFQKIYGIARSIFCVAAASRRSFCCSCTWPVFGGGDPDGCGFLHPLDRWILLTARLSSTAPSNLSDLVQFLLLLSSRIQRVGAPRLILGPVPGPVSHPEAFCRPGTRQPADPVSGPVTCLKAITAPGTCQPAVSGTIPGPITHLEAVTAPRTRQTSRYRSHSRTRPPSGGRHYTRDPSSSQSRTHHSSEGCTSIRDQSASSFRARHPYGGRPLQQDLSSTRSRHPSGYRSSTLDLSTTCSQLQVTASVLRLLRHVIHRCVD